jgi:hypothetical protein
MRPGIHLRLMHLFGCRRPACGKVRLWVVDGVERPGHELCFSFGFGDPFRVLRSQRGVDDGGRYSASSFEQIQRGPSTPPHLVTECALPLGDLVHDRLLDSGERSIVIVRQAR